MAARVDGAAFVRAAWRWLAALLVAVAALGVAPARAQLLPVDVIDEGQLNATQGGLPLPFIGTCAFGTAIARLGDLDGDGLASIAVGAPNDANIGAVWVLELEADGAVANVTRIGPEPFGMGSSLSSADEFGRSVDALGDVDGDGVTDLAVGAPGDTSGAVWVLFLTADGGIRDQVRIGATTPGLCEVLATSDVFGRSVAALGDRNGDGTPDVAVGAPQHDEGGTNTGAVFILSLSPEAGLVGCTRIASGVAGLPALDPSDVLGSSLAALGDLGGDGTLELAVGAPGDDDGGSNSGAVWLLSLDDSGLVTATHKLPSSLFGGAVSLSNPMGGSVGAVGDLDGDGIADLAVGVPGDDDGFPDSGAVWILFLQADGTVRALRKISNLAGGFGGLASAAAFGGGLPPSLRGDAQPLLAGAPGGGPPGDKLKGAAWLLTLDLGGGVVDSSQLVVGTAALNGGLEPGDGFVSAAANLGDRDGDGFDEIALGSPGDDDGIANGGALWIVELEADGALAQQPVKLSALSGVQGMIGSAALGSAIAPLGDLSGDGTLEVAVGGPGDDAGTSDAGAVWLLSLDDVGQLVAQTKLSALSPGLAAGALSAFDAFGSALAAPGDLDGDGVPDLLVGAPFDDDATANTGAVWVLLLLPSGGIKAAHKLSATQGGLGPGLAQSDEFGRAITVFGDTDGDGRVELVVGAPGADDSGPEDGACWLLELEPGGAGVHSAREINALTAALPAPVFTTAFGSALATLPDLDADGRPELVAGAPFATLGASQCGAIGVLSVRPDGSVRDHREIGNGSGGFGGVLQAGDNFGLGLSLAGDLDGNGAPDLVIGAPKGGDPVGGGAAWTLRLPVSAWSSQSAGLAGTHGVPLIAVLGPLVPGTPLRFELNEARRYAPCWLFLGLTELLAPFKGGVLVPNPVMVVPQSTDGFGFKSFGGTWPAGVPTGSTLYAQWWVMDQNAIQGLSATAAAKGVVP
jgi:hypothetical protein